MHCLPIKILITCLVCLPAFNLMAQRNTPPEIKYRNSVNTHLGLIEFNFNYERNILQQAKSYTNVRAGIGYWTNLQLEGNCVEAAVVHVLGRKNSHPEFNLGIKYILAKGDKENAVLPLIYTGYRYENPDGRYIFRIGLAFPSIFNLGIGTKF